MKLCPGCKIEKQITEFWKNQSACIECSKYRQKHRWHSRTPKKRLEAHLRDKYKISTEVLHQRLEEQNYKCAICKEPLPDLLVYENRRRGYAIDHNHDSGEFRGVLCTNCNSLLGMAKDNKYILEAAIIYLEVNGTYAWASKQK